jgi:hypothetical protein
MMKLKLGPLADDKPVKISIELPARVHRDLIAYADPWSDHWPVRARSGQVDRADDRTVHGDGSGIR